MGKNLIGVARGGRRCARLRRAGEGAGDSGAERGEAAERETAERQHRRWYCTAEYCGRGVAATLRTSEIRLGGSFFV